jgi:hypothetical protein
VPRARVERELAELYRQAGFRGLPLVVWSPQLAQTHRENRRRYAQVALGGGLPPRFELAPQVVWLPGKNRRALLAHEVGHALDPDGGEDDADAAALRGVGVRIGYDRRWPGKGLQVQLNPGGHLNPPPGDRGLREALRAATAEGHPLAEARAIRLRRRHGALPGLHEMCVLLHRLVRRIVEPHSMQVGGSQKPPVDSCFPPNLCKPARFWVAVHGSGGSHIMTVSFNLAEWSASVSVKGFEEVEAFPHVWGAVAAVEGLAEAMGMAVSRGEIEPCEPYWSSSEVYPERYRKNPPAGDRRLRQLARAWKEGGGAHEHAAYLREAMRRGRADPAKLWILARMDAPEREAVQIAFGEVVPFAPHWSPPNDWWNTRFYDLLTADILHELNNRRGDVVPVPLHRLFVRRQAYAELFRALSRLVAVYGPALDPETSQWEEAPGELVAQATLAQEMVKDGPDQQVPPSMIMDFASVSERFVHWFNTLSMWSNVAHRQMIDVPQRVVSDCESELADEGDEPFGWDEVLDCVSQWALAQGSGVWDYQMEEVDALSEDPDDPVRAVGYPGTWFGGRVVFEYLLASLYAWLRGDPEPQPDPLVRRWNPPRRPRRNPGWKTPPPCAPGPATKKLKHAVPLAKLKGKQVRVHVNLHNGCYVISHKGRVAGYARSLKLKDVTPKVSLQGWRACNTTQVRNVHAYLVGTLVSASAKRPKGKSWSKITYRCKEHGPCFYYPSTDKTFEGAAEVVFLNAGGEGFAQIEVMAKGRAKKANPPSCPCRHPGGLCACGQVQAWWLEPPPGCGC